MKFRHRVFLKVSALVFALSVMAGIASFAVADGGPTYEAEVDGVTKVLTIGTEVAQGTLLSDGNCDFPNPVVITGNPTEQENSGKVTSRVTEDCMLLVSNLEWRQVTSGSESRSSPQPSPNP